MLSIRLHEAQLPPLLHDYMKHVELDCFLCVSQVVPISHGKHEFCGSVVQKIEYQGTRDKCSYVSGEGLSLVFRRWATKKTAGSTKNGRDSKPKNLGVKKFGGERVIPGNIIVRQRGTRFHPGNYVGIGKDHTLFAMKEGCVKFERNKLTGRKWVHVEPKEGHVLHPMYSDASASELKVAV
ncbi:hypothetical protein Ahy_A09g046002 [Arachis hypogaea]|uniref:50S ribosomal protein n=1 Tax=Arachis hypogaea TaxID=3818 RepID=A0A445BNQ5_ARAHY|nr:hypothetical protein Ahy_A09g046002 [Arachis hypogaea]